MRKIRKVMLSKTRNWQYLMTTITNINLLKRHFMLTKTIYVNKAIFMSTKTCLCQQRHFYVNTDILCQQRHFYVNKDIFMSTKTFYVNKDIFMSTKTFYVIGTYGHPVRKKWRLTELFTVKWAVCQLCSWEQVYKQYII